MANTDRPGLISHHLYYANTAATLASTLLSEAVDQSLNEMTPEQKIAVSSWKAGCAMAAAQVADAHTRLLQLRLAVEDF